MKLNIPIVAILDTNSDPVGINYPIPGNDDARRAINLYCDLIKQTILAAQNNITEVKIEEFDAKKNGKTDLKIDIKKESKKMETKKKEKIKTVKKISKSILSKVKSLTSKKEK